MVQALVFEPRKAFAALRARPRFWMPLLAVVLATAGTMLWYQLVVDAEWLMDLQLRNSQLTEAQIEAQVRAAAGVGGTVRAVIVGIFTTVSVVLLFLASAVYYLLAGKITNVRCDFRQWLALTGWTSLPSVITAVPVAVMLLTATTSQIDPGEMQPLSLNALFFHRAMGDPGYSLLSSINLPMLLSLYLVAVGVKEWSGRSWLFSTVFAWLPTVLIFGFWAYFSLGRS